MCRYNQPFCFRFYHHNSIIGNCCCRTAGIQDIKRCPFTPLMMTGNLRTLAETSVDSLIFHHTEAQQTLFNTAIIMLTFAFGAALVAIATPVLKDASVILPALPLFGAWIFSKKASDL